MRSPQNLNFIAVFKFGESQARKLKEMQGKIRIAKLTK